MSLIEISDRWRPRFSTTDAMACRDYIQESTGTHRFALDRRSGFVDFCHHEAAIGQVLIHLVKLRSSEGFRVRKAARAPYYAFQFVLEGSCRLSGEFGSTIAQTGDAFILDPDHRTEETWSKDCSQLLLRIDADVVRQVAADALGQTVGHIRFDPVAADPGIVHWLKHHFLSLQHGGSEADLLMAHRVVVQLEKLLITMLLTGIRNSESEALSHCGPSIAPYYVRRAEAFMREHVNQPLSVRGIAEHAGVSPRTLFYGFRRWRNCTPMGWLRDLRLAMARREIEAARSRGGSVSRAAMHAGFNNFSRFSQAYKTRYGETPSSTLRKA